MPVETVQYSPDGQYIAVGGGASVGGIVKIWEAGSGALIKSMKYPDRAVRSVAFSPNGKELVVAGLTHIKVWDWQ